MRSLLFLSFFISIFISVPSTRAAEPFEIVDGDRVLLLGDTLLERENTYGYLETRMHEQFPDRRFTVRNLSWAGDTPAGWSRASFDPPAKGLERLKEAIALVKPTVVFLGYGMAASLQEMTDRAQDITLNPDPTRYGAEPMTAARFKRELGELMDVISTGGSSAGASPAGRVPAGASPASAAAAGAAAGPLPAGGAPALRAATIRFVLLSPIRHEDLRAVRPGLPNPAPHNALLEQYSKAIEELAKERGARFVGYLGFPLTGPFLQMMSEQRKDASNTSAELAILEALERSQWLTDNGIHLNANGYGSVFANVIRFALGWLRPASATAANPDAPGIVSGFNDMLEIYSLGPGKVDDLDPGSEAWIKREKESEALRAAVLKKNDLFFHRFRPENATYLFGFRKHEQGQNAVEIAQFDPLIAAADAEIDRLKKAGATAAKIEPTKPANPLAQAEPPPRPDFTVLDGYQIELWAENPLLEKPTQMNWDAQGRLWVCSSSLYPQIAPGEDAHDKILILEDTDRDGRADKSTVFADGLLIPTGVVPDLAPESRTATTQRAQRTEKAVPDSNSAVVAPVASSRFNSACYVGQSTELLHFTDTDGDGQADLKRVVFSGFGTEDTHHLIHTLKWGPDGRLYFNQSIYIHSHLETPWGMVRLNSGGIFAYDPRTERVEVFAKGWCNPWGHAWDEWGQSFVTDGAGFQGISWVIPGAQYFTYENARKIAPSISPGSYPKFAGLELIRSPHFPEDWQGNAITCDFRAHRIVRFEIQDLAEESRTAAPRHGEEKDGNATIDSTRAAPSSDHSTLNSQPSTLRSGYLSREMPDLVRTGDQSFRPIDVRLGPDGALYVADWSNPVINHGEVDFRDPRRDKHMGRIWRISRKDAPVVKWEDFLAKAVLSKKSTTKEESEKWEKKSGEFIESLMPKLLSSSAWEREQTRRVLVGAAGVTHSPASLVKGVIEWLEKEDHSLGELESAQLWKNEPGLLSPGMIINLAGDKDPAIRSAAPRILSAWLRDNEDTRAEALKILEGGSIPANVATKPLAEFDLGKTAENLGVFAADLLQRLISDRNPRVRVEAMRALARLSTAQSAALVLEAAVGGRVSNLSGQRVSNPQEASRVENPGAAQAASPRSDPHYEYAAWLSINDLAQPWTDAIASGAWKADTADRQRQLEWGLKAIDPALAGATLAKLMTDGQVPLDGSGPWIELLGQAGGPKELRALLEKVAASQLPADTEARALNALAEAARLRNTRPEGDLKASMIGVSGGAGVSPAAPGILPGASAVGRPAETGGTPVPPGITAARLRLAGLWKMPDAEPLVIAAAGDAKSAPEVRAAAFESLRLLGKKDALATFTNAEQPREIRRVALVALAQLDLPAAVAKASDVLPALTEEAVALETWRGLLAVKGAADAFAAKLPRELPKTVAAAGVRAAREAGKNGAKLLAALTPLAGLSPAQASLPKDFKWMVDLAKRDGDPARGELIYRRAALACTTCHAIGGAGGKAGPDMTSLGASAPLDYIIESVLDPAMKVKEGYNAVAFTLKDGTQATGIQARETAQEIFLRDATGREQAIAKAQIAATTNIGSLMPAGLTAQLEERERLDLFAFFGELGKPGPYDASKGKVARVWWIFSGADAAKVLGGEIKWESAWPGYTLVDGRFEKELLAAAAPLVANGSDTLIAVAQFQGAGKTRLKLTGAQKVWLDGKPLALTPDLAPELAEGTHTLAVKLDVNALPTHLRAESPDARFLGN